MKIAGKCAIITGGAEGFGKALVESLVAESANVVFGDIAVDKGSALERKLKKDGKKVVFCKCDVRSESDLISLFQTADTHFGGAQILINNAGIGPKEQLTTTTAVVDLITDINLKAVFKGTSLAIQHFMKQKKNSSSGQPDFCVINMSSASAIFPMGMSPIYSTTKKGVMFFSQVMRFLRKDNIRVNCVLPSFAKTELTMTFNTDHEFQKLVKAAGGFISISDLVTSVHMLITDESKAGEAFLITPTRRQYLPYLNKSFL